MREDRRASLGIGGPAAMQPAIVDLAGYWLVSPGCLIAEGRGVQACVQDVSRTESAAGYLAHHRHCFSARPRTGGAAPSRARPAR